MKRITLMMALALAAFAFSMDYSGNVFLNPRVKSIYVSPGCPNRDSLGHVLKKSENDVLLKSKDKFGWYKYAVKNLLDGDTIAPFCFYSGEQDTLVEDVYDEGELVGYSRTYYYSATRVFSESDFDKQKNLYIDFWGSSTYHKKVTPPVVYFKTDWKNNYVVLDGYRFVPVTKKNSKGWYVVSNEFKSMYVRMDIKVDSVQTTEYEVVSRCKKDDDGYCIIDDETGSTIIERDTIGSRKVWKHVYDTLATDTLYHAYDGLISFTDQPEHCQGHFIYKDFYNVGGSYTSEYFCFKSELGIKPHDTLYVFENPKKAHETLVRTKEPEALKTLHVIPPQIAKWFGETPSFSTDGKNFTDMDVETGHCGWYSTLFFEEKIPTKATFYNAEDHSLTFAKKVNIDSLFKKLKTNELFYVSNDPEKVYWYAEDPNYEGICSVHLQGIVYDTDAELHPAFSCYAGGGEGCQVGAQGVEPIEAQAAVNACIGVTPGIVGLILGDDHKPVLTKAGERCFINSDFFNQLFNSTDGVNETSCSTIPFTLNSLGKWEFSSDYYTSPGAPVVGGYYPAELTENGDIVAGNPLPEARKKRPAEGPVFIGPVLRELDSTEKVMKMNVLCQGIGWNKGIDCAGLFANGDDLNMPVSSYLGISGGSSLCVWGWSCSSDAPEGWTFFDSYEKVSTREGGNPRWSSTTPGRNQHFCFESHAKFTYKKGQKFGVRGDDDIWIFIGGKLAIDLGGTHMAAPGYADLSLLTDKNDEPLVVGNTYDIDIFFCDRRTTMSNMNIFSNIYLDQSDVAERMKPCEVEVEDVFEEDPEHLGEKAIGMTRAAKSNLRVGVQALRIEVSGLTANEPVALLDLQGRVIASRRASSSTMQFEVRNAGRYIVKTQKESSLVLVK